MSLFEIETKFYSRHVDAVTIYVESLRTQRDKLLEYLKSYTQSMPDKSIDERDQCNSIVEVIEDLARHIQEINDRIEDIEIDLR